MEQEKSEKNLATEITEDSSKPIEHEKSEKKTENDITEVFSSKPIEQEKSEKKPENEITEVSSSKPIEQEKSEKKPDNEISEASSKPIEKEKSEKKSENEITEASSSKPPSSLKQTPKSLKARAKLVKNKMKTVKDSPNAVKNPAKVTNSPNVAKSSPIVKNLPSLVKRPLTIGKTSPKKDVNKASNSTPQMLAGKNKKRKRGMSQGNKASSYNEIKNAEKLNDKANEGKKVSEQDPNVKNLQDQKSEKKRVEPEKGGPSSKNKEKQRGLDKISKEGTKRLKKEGSEKSLKYVKSADKRPQRHQENGRTKEDELGGLIFMCNTKTKPDCFRYRVMGVSMGKKDLMLSIKPGIRLFLYDFDRKLLYGIYKATSSGGMKLEPAAFGGAFPVQVRFDVHQECYPLPESTFKSAIKENYNERNKFKTELTLQQVRRLLDLYRPAESRSNGEQFDSQQVPRSVSHQEVYEGERSSRRSPSRNHKRRSNGRENDEHVSYRTESARREEVPQDSFLSEQEYRTYGLQGHRRSQMPSPNQRSREQDQLLRHPPLMYREDTIPASGHILGHSPALYRETGAPQIERVLRDPFSLGEKEYETYGHRIPYQSQYYDPTASYADPYLQPPTRRDDMSSSSYLQDHQRGMPHFTETDVLMVRPDELEMEYLSYNSSGLPDYNLGRAHSRGSNKPEAIFAPVSSRYSFAGPSSTYR